MTARPRKKKVAADGDGSVYYLQRADRPARWMVSLRDLDGRRKTYVAEKQSEAGAEAHLRRLLRERDAGETARANAQHTLATWLDEWLDTKQAAGARSRTLESYRERIATHILPRLGDKPLRRLTPDDVQAAYNAMLRSKSRTTGRKLSRTTASLVHQTLRAMLRAARRRRLVGFVATEMVEPPVREEYEARPLTLDEARRLLAAFATHQHGALWTFMLGTGVRFGEAAGLTWENVDLDNATVRIAQQVTRERYIDDHGNTRVRHVIAPVKTTAGKRTVALPAFAVAVLREQRARIDAIREHATRRKKVWDDTYPTLVFPNSRGGLLHENTILVTWHRLLRSPAVALEGQPGQAPLRMHDLRHTKGTLMADAGEDTTTIQRTLGHASQRITADLYIGSTANEQRRAADRYGDLFDGVAPEAAYDIGGEG